MTLLGDFDQLSLILMASIALLGGLSVLLCCWHRYEVAICLMLLSPWVNWLLYSNIPKAVDEEGAVGPASYLRILLVLLIGCCGTVQFLRSWYSGQIKAIPGYLICFALFVFYAVMSTGYSLDQKFTLIRSCEFLIFFMFLLGLHTWLNNRRKLDRTLNIYYWVIVVGILLNTAALILLHQRAWAWKMPDRFQGLTDHPNMLGALCLLSYPILGWKYSTSRQAGKFTVIMLVCITGGMHILSGSRSSLLAAAVGGMVWGVLSIRHITLKHIAGCLIGIFIVTMGASSLLLLKPASLTRGDESITTLTGRTEFWKGCLLLIREEPVQGYGFAVAGKVWEDPRFHREGEFLWEGSAKSSLHNGYLSIAVGLGLVGFGMWLGLIAVPTWKTLSLEATPYKALVLAVIVSLFVLNFFESAISSGSQIHTSLYFWFILIIAGRLPQLSKYSSQAVSATYKESNIERLNPSTNIPAGLCLDHAGA